MINENGMVDSEKVNEEVIDIDLIKLLGNVRQNILAIISCIVICACVAFMYSQIVAVPTYTADIMIYIKNNRQTKYTANAVNDLSASQMLVDNYKLLLSDDIVLDAVGKKLVDKYGLEQLSSLIGISTNSDGEQTVSSRAIAASLSMSPVDETEILKISCTTISPELSADICNYLVEVAPQSMSEIMGISYVAPIGYAVVPNSRTSPNTPKNTAIGAIVGAVIAALYIFAKYYLFNREIDTEVLSSRFGLSVLGEIPKFDVDKGEA